MYKNKLFRISLIIFLCGIFYLLGYYNRNNSIVNVNVSHNPNPHSKTPYLDILSKENLCPEVFMSVSDQFSCIYNLATSTSNEVKSLERSIVDKASLRLERINDNASGLQMPWEFGGWDSVRNLPIIISAIESSREPYYDSLCYLDSMKIFGSSGMDLEEQACRYYHARENLEMLKSLEARL